MKLNFEVCRSAETNRPPLFLILPEGSRAPGHCTLADNFAIQRKIYLTEDLQDRVNCEAMWKEMLVEEGIRAVDILAFGSAVLGACFVSASLLRSVRHLALIDPVMHQSLSVVRILRQGLSIILPFGMPASSRAIANARSVPERVRCPTLLLSTGAANRDVLITAEKLHLCVPNAWPCRLEVLPFDKSGALHPACVAVLERFLETAVRRSQKNL